MSQRDSIYSSPLEAVQGFRFDERVVEVFPDMIQRSVPGYATVVAISGVLAEHYVQTGSRIYDLGCSLGATTFAMATRMQAIKRQCELVAVDNSEAMLQGLEQLLAKEQFDNRVDCRLEDIAETAIDNASMVTLNYTLQFIPVEQRLALLQKIYDGMNPGGVLVLSEKIAFEDQAVDDLFINLHHDFKRANGYSDLEISQKRSALENVLIPETLDCHFERLKAAGFKRTEVWFQCFNFASLVAFK
jgi:tRNA (cmo5U34)-methyltransferase